MTVTGSPGSSVPSRNQAQSKYGRVIAFKYGAHVDDQWSVEELLGHADHAAESSHSWNVGPTSLARGPGS
jgi:hypothetical protein